MDTKTHDEKPNSGGQVDAVVVPFDLQPFCADYDTVYNLKKPFSEGNYTVATDGIILVRVPRREDVPIRDDGFSALGVHTIFFETEPEEWFSLPAVEVKQVPCRNCGGVGQIFFCPECDGEGEISFDNDWNDYTVTCDTCGGDGFLKKEKWLDVTKASGKDATCEDCDGTGKEIQEKGIKIGSAWFTDSILAKLAGLPGPVEVGPLNDNHPARLRFVGGDGLVMVRSGE